MKAPDEIVLMREAEAAALLRVQPGTMRAWRHRKVGPPWVKVGPGSPRYVRSQLVEWLERQKVAP